MQLVIEELIRGVGYVALRLVTVGRYRGGEDSHLAEGAIGFALVVVVLLALSLGELPGQARVDGRVAHGYLILSFAAGLFVDPDPGPVLANTGLENLRFLTPLYPGDSMRVELTVKSKSVRNEEMGEVRWAVYVFNQKDDVVASYDLLTMNTP